MGGNAMRDAVRLLCHQADLTDADYQPLLPPAVMKDIVNRLNITIGWLNEVELAEDYHEKGVRMLHVGNSRDEIAPPSPHKHRHNDRIMIGEGSYDNFGHSPGIMRAIIDQSPELQDHYTAAASACIDRAAISHIHYGQLPDANGVRRDCAERPRMRTRAQLVRGAGSLLPRIDYCQSDSFCL